VVVQFAADTCPVPTLKLLSAAANCITTCRCPVFFDRIDYKKAKDDEAVDTQAKMFYRGILFVRLVNFAPTTARFLGVR